MDDSDIEALSNQQVLTGIEDVAKEKFGWGHAYVTNNEGAIIGMVIGLEEVIVRMKPKREGYLQ